MATNYPAALDTTTQLPNTWTDATTSATVHKDAHNNTSDAIRAIEGELGLTPKGSFASVAARLNARLTCRSTADQTLSSVVALTNLTSLTLPISTTNLDYFFRFVIVCTSSAGATNGIRIGLTCPTLTGYVAANVTSPRTLDTTQTAGTAQTVAPPSSGVGQINSSGDSVVYDIVPIGVNFVVTVEGILSQPSATGSIQLQGANEVTTASGNVIKRGSYGEIYIN